MNEERKFDTDTDKFLAVRYPNLDSSWLKDWLADLNDTIGWLKEKFSGNALMQVPWSGGRPAKKPDWSVKVQPDDKKKRT